MDSKKIGKFILLLRKEKNLTQFQLGEILGVSDKTISKWERGICLPTPIMVEKLNEFFDITIMEFYAGERNKKLKDEIVNETIKNAVEITKQNKNKEIKKIILLVIISFLLLTFILLAIFTYNTYDKYSAFQISSSNDDYSINGNIIFAGKKNYISMFDLEIINEELSNSKGYCFEYTLMIDDILIYKQGDIYTFEKNNQSKLIQLGDYTKEISIYINYDISELLKNEDLLNKELILKINYLNESMEVENRIMMFKFSELYSNNNLINN